MYTQGSGNIIRQQRQVSNFNRVSSKGSFHITITQGNEQLLVIEAEDYILPYIQTEIINGELLIDFINHNCSCNIQPTKQIKLSVTMKDVVALKTSGSSKIHSASIATAQLNIETSGSSNVNINSLIAKTLVVVSKGSTAINLAGQIEKQEIELKGSSEYLASKLDSQTAILDISGSGTATILAGDILDITISGSGKVNYYGSPHLTQKTSGSVKITNLGSSVA
ncbi:MAG: head GIN domain-containing protein [Phormidium sp.]